ncbi:hypothetical protein J6590_104485, partial [Homalodisca vitripennis]
KGEHCVKHKEAPQCALADTGGRAVCDTHYRQCDRLSGGGTPPTCGLLYNTSQQRGPFDIASRRFVLGTLPGFFIDHVIYPS